ncbi:hypothetical protein FB567DRAFT_71171 [Paraphoma chrysanthemicola]|uniref:Transmembrane protein n=1 Tax=Paraphoma chrysanthemicola TaxID=798071 RepID=A0A8K0VYI8_9PLEO|nr:hypothetical protein FB567DRAFT_71171 [Paraphoma chrysanthemicola]
MTFTTMRTAVLQAAAIWTVMTILDHHLSENMFDKVWEDEMFRNMTSVLNGTTSHAATNQNPKQLTLDAGNTTLPLNQSMSVNNATATNGTSGLPAWDAGESIYGWRLPREGAIFIILAILEYYWFIWLEKILPARSRRRDVSHQRHEKVEESEDREEEIIQRWIAQGRVKRASLNWCNTFLKLTLQLTIGTIWYSAAAFILRVLFTKFDPRLVFKGMKSHIVFSFIGSYVTVQPLATLIAFVVIPAHRQIVFLSGANLVSSVFFTTLVRLFAAWLVKTQFAQDFMRNMTSSALDGTERRRYSRTRNEL